MPKFVKNLKDLDKNDCGLVGTKAAYLGEIMKMGILVPPGFVVTAEAYEKFLENNDLSPGIHKILNDIKKDEINSIEIASEKIRNLIIAAKIPVEIIEEIQEAFNALDLRSAAVRSSATAEDSKEAAWAGQMQTYLNTTAENLLDNIKKCWASLYSARAIFYRIEKEMFKQNQLSGVIVQKMVESKISGTVFSANPTNPEKNQIVIEAGFGLGEIILSGQVTPDTYFIDKANLLISNKIISEQKREDVAELNQNIAIPKVQQTQQKIGDEEILFLARISLKIEKLLGFPVDMEWAKENGKFYFLQSRPITALKKFPIEQPQNTIDYIKNQLWFFGVRADELLLLYSAKNEPYDKLIKDEYGIQFAETMLLPLSKNKHVRAFNLLQAKNFHQISLQKLLQNPQILGDYIKKDDEIWTEINSLQTDLKTASAKGDFIESAKIFTKLMNFFEISTAHFFIIFSLGLKLVENKKEIKDAESFVAMHNKWRNAFALKQEKLAKHIKAYFKSLLKTKNVKISPASLIKYLTLNEIKNWIADKLSDQRIQEVVAFRKKRGYIYLKLKNTRQEIINDKEKIKELCKYFSKQNKASKNGKQIIGQIAWSIGKKIKAKAVIVKNRADLKQKQEQLKGKILVAVQTTPHYIPYLKDVAGIITDEGGITCHAAILSREFNKPCIMGTKNATQLLKDGDQIELDTEKGIVNILRR